MTLFRDELERMNSPLRRFIGFPAISAFSIDIRIESFRRLLSLARALASTDLRKSMILYLILTSSILIRSSGLACLVADQKFIAMVLFGGQSTGGLSRKYSERLVA